MQGRRAPARRDRRGGPRLRHGGARQAELAAELGYADQPHFIRDFARVTGMTPGEFAVHARAGGPPRTV